MKRERVYSSTGRELFCPTSPVQRGAAVHVDGDVVGGLTVGGPKYWIDRDRLHDELTPELLTPVEALEAELESRYCSHFANERAWRSGVRFGLRVYGCHPNQFVRGYEYRMFTCISFVTDSSFCGSSSSRSEPWRRLAGPETLIAPST